MAAIQSEDTATPGGSTICRYRDVSFPIKDLVAYTSSSATSFLKTENISSRISYMREIGLLALTVCRGVREGYTTLYENHE